MGLTALRTRLSAALPANMRIAVFAHNSNPAIDRFLVKKSLTYALELVSKRAADWLDSYNPARGCKLRGRFLERHEASLNKAAGSGFDTAWSIRQSGYAGPLVWQLKSATV